MSTQVAKRADPAETPGAAQDKAQYLTFALEHETFAIGILAIKEIIEYGHLTEVPMMPEFIRGVINLRGSVVPVVDLMARFGKGKTITARRTCIVIVEAKAGEDEVQEFGVLVDAVNEVLEIPREEVEPAPAFGTRIRPDFIHGMGKVNGRFVIILDVDQVLSLEDMANLMALASGGRENLAVATA